VIWLGLDGLDWELLDRLSADGRMPNWKRLTEQGYTARLRSFVPTLSPIVWTTIATGVGPDVHRVLDFQELEPEGGRKEPISGRSRAVPAIWNIASEAGRTVGVVGWWATHPAEQVRGFFVSDRASPILFEGLSRGNVAYPASLAAGVQQIAARESEVPDGDLEPYLNLPPEEISRLRAAGGGIDNPIVALATIIGATRSEQRIGRELYDRNLPDLMMLYFEGTDAIGHVFASYLPPKLPCVSEENFARYRRAVDVYYGMVDRVLGQWMRRADEDGATLIVNSDHGFKWGADRPCERPSLNPSTAAFWHRIDGVFAAYGHRVPGSPQRGDATVFDLEPTIAALLDLPVDRRETGRVIEGAFSGLRPPPHEDLFGRVAVRRLAAEKLSEQQADEYARRLRSLGYLSGNEPASLAPTGGERPGMTEAAWNNLGLYLRDNTRDLAAAESAFRKALELAPAFGSPRFNLAVLERMRGRNREAIDWLFRSFEAGHADPEGTALRWFSEYAAKGELSWAGVVLERAAAIYPTNELIGRQLGMLRFQMRDCAGAAESVARFEAVTRDPETLNALALFRACLGRTGDAVALLEKSLALKPDQPAVIQSLNRMRGSAQSR
jgi:predicted AlkP superfamily phosphohydrolase/phosphomutase/Flp pilus assembly protein TadD